MTKKLTKTTAKTPAKRTRRPQKSKCRLFPIMLDSGTVEPPSLEEYWFGEGTDQKLDMDDDDYDEAVEGYEELYGTITFECDCAVFNLEEWADIDCFYPENKRDEKPFDRLYSRSYKIALSCETWWEDCCVNHYAAHGKFRIEKDNGFYDDLKAIKNGYVRECIENAFNKFLSNKCEAVDDASGSELTEWEPDEWHATGWGSPLD